MTTYYLNDASLNWVLTANNVTSNSGTDLNINTTGLTNRLNISNTTDKYTNSLVLDSSSIEISVAYLTNINKMSMSILSNQIKFNSTVSGVTTTILTMDISGNNTFTNLPTSSAVPSSNSELVNKLYVDNPIQQVTFVRGGTNLICNYPKFVAAGSTTHPSATQNVMGFLYPTKNITITNLVSHTSNSGTYSTGSTFQRMVLVSFPSLVSNVATVVARTTNNTSLWSSFSQTYDLALISPVTSYTLVKGTKYAIVCLSNSAANFDLRGRTYTNADTFNFSSTYDLQIGGTYNTNADLDIGNTFTVSSTGASNVPYVSAY